MTFREIPAQRYEREVLPLTAPLWAGRRTFEEYISQTLEIARSSFGRRHYRTMGLYEGATLLASFKQYERVMRLRSQRLPSVGFGAVFTPEEYRGRGYASVMLAMALDRARGQGYALAYLFSDISPQFYAALGFRELPSRAFSLRTSSLPSRRLKLARLEDDDWTGVRQAYGFCEDQRVAGFVRTPAVWNWIGMRARHRSERPAGDETNLAVRRRRRICAYVLGVRAPERDAYILDEYGFADEDAAAAIPALLRCAAGDLRRVLGWLPPNGARDLLPSLSVRRRTRPVLMMLPLRREGAALFNAVAANSRGDFCWATEHV